MMRLCALLAGCLLASNLAAASVELKGSRTCGKWMDETRLAKGAQDMHRIPVLITRGWFLGYLSGRAGASGKDFLKGTDSESIFLWLDNYCRANPDKDLDQGGIDLARELMQMKGIKP